VPESIAEVPAGDQPWPVKSPHRLRAVFASRIATTKNLQFLLEVLARCEGDIHLDIVGPLEDPDYWARCQSVMQRLPPTITVAYIGEAAHDDLQRRLSTWDLMILPTLGENFGHVIVEAWAAGCPVLVSDRTPWRQLRSRGLGWDVPLDHQAWIGAIDECLDMGAAAHLMMRRRSREQARRVWQDGATGDASLRRLFEEAARRPESDVRGDLVPDLVGARDIDSCT
jgi:glycosyltransferase involved in cell wall biosynthesis